MSDTKLVYSTETGNTCPECGKKNRKCACQKKKVENKYQARLIDGVVRIKREVNGRKGKTVTSIYGIPLEDNKLRQFAKTLKQRCGTGGTTKEGVIIIQGDHRDVLMAELKKQGYNVKLAGG